jgi:ParB family transcriptional regulator, chromosome partitioning protein
MNDPIIALQTEAPENTTAASPSKLAAARVDPGNSSPPAEAHPVYGAVRLLPFSQIRLPTTTNRDESRFQGKEFDAFVDLIHAAGGNSVPVLVRPLHEPVGEYLYDLVSGERRTRACGKRRLLVLAWVVNDCDDDEALLKRLRENAGRVDLSPYELGLQVNAALAAGALHSLGHAAREIGRDKSDLSKATQLAALPEPVLAAFSCRTELQYRHAKPLKDAVAANPGAVLAEAARLVAERPSTPQLVALLVKAANGGVGPSNTPAAAQPIEIDGKTVGRWRTGAGGKLTIELQLPLERRDQEALRKSLDAFLRRRVLKTAAAPKSSTPEAA